MSRKYFTLDHDLGHYLSKLSFTFCFPILFSYFCVLVSSFVNIQISIARAWKKFLTCEFPRIWNIMEATPHFSAKLNKMPINNGGTLGCRMRDAVV